MKRRTALATVAAVAAFVIAVWVATPRAQTTDERIGQVNFPTSCAVSMQKPFERAVALLHSFWYIEAAKAFTAVTQADPDCAIAYWDLAMSQWTQIWAPPPAAALKRGWDAVEKAKAANAKTPRERDFVGAARAPHALAHLRAPRHVAGDDPEQRRGRRGREGPGQPRRPDARARLPGLRLPATGAGRGGQEGRRRGALHHGRPRRAQLQLRACHRRLRDGGDRSALGDGARPLGGRGGHRAAAHALRAHRRDDSLRAGDRRRPHRQRGSGAGGDREAREPA